jgi:hypothetical protein
VGDSVTEPQGNIGIIGFFRENPTFILTLAYVDLTGIGILYAIFFCRVFGINIFDFAEIGDFLLAAFKAPLVTFLLLLGQVFFVCLSLLLWRGFRASLVNSVTRALEHLRRPSSESLTGRLVGAPQFFTAYVPRIVGTVVGIVLLVGTVIIAVQSARHQAHAIKQGEQQKVAVQYRQFSNTTEQAPPEHRLELIGATQRAAFIYDVGDKRTIVIPQSQIVSIEVRD